jgi:hypothetical protein
MAFVNLNLWCGLSGFDSPLAFGGGTDLKIGHYGCAPGGASPSPTKELNTKESYRKEGIAYKGIAYKGNCVQKESRGRWIGFAVGCSGSVFGVGCLVQRCGRVLLCGVAWGGLVRIGSGLQVE